MSVRGAAAGGWTADEGLALAARGLALGYGRRRVLEGVSLEVRRGAFWCLVGPNGSGKSTLLRAVLGVIDPLDGDLWIAPDLASRRRVGFVPQRCDLKPTLPMTVRELVLLGLTGTGAAGRESRADVSWALERVGLAAVARRDYWSLSGGQRQRALVARGLARRPTLLILDEPTNGLDLAAEESILELVAALNRDRGLTILFVTHAIALAARFATHVALFGGGRLLAGPRDEVLRGGHLREAYGVDVEVVLGGAGQPVVRIGPPPGAREAPGKPAGCP
ncbi:MAG: ABC transporter ATP-binding protein [Planctomycetes bacterium]|nr:ABC transporter ATP-binding protein [Planctomycetota bacterium]